MPIETTPLDPLEISQSYSYEPESGVIVSRYWGKPVGRLSQRGYVVLSLDSGRGKRRTVFAHRIAYVLMSGEDIPSGKYIDHINRDRGDNRWVNLRICTHQQNLLNSRRDRDNGLPPGVYENKGSKVRPFKAKIKIGGGSVYLGSFDSVEQAKTVFDAAWAEAHREP